MSVIPPFLSVTSTPSVRTPSVLITVHAKQVLLAMENGARVSKMNKILFCSNIFICLRACSGRDAENEVNEQLY